MTVALAGRVPATFEIKSASLLLVSLLLKSTDLAALAAELKERVGDIPTFFDNDPLVIDLSLLQTQGEAAIDFPELLHLLRAHGLTPVALRGGSEEQMRLGKQIGLASAPEAATAARVRQQEKSAAPEPVPAAISEPPSPSALVIDTPLRSGQQIYARGRDLVVMSMVNPGAEVIADGHIHVYAPLRGKAIAGARGNADARIFSMCLEPELISIAGVYRTSEVPLPREVLGKPTQVRLDAGDGKLVMTALKA